jgi:hypothetical protein
MWRDADAGGVDRLAENGEDGKGWARGGVTAVIPLFWQQPVSVELRCTLRGRELLLNALRRKEDTVVRWHNKGTRFAGPWGPCAHPRVLLRVLFER